MPDNPSLDEFAERDEWWAGLSNVDSSNWFERHRRRHKKSDVPTNYQTVITWAWEE